MRLWTLVLWTACQAPDDGGGDLATSPGDPADPTDPADTPDPSDPADTPDPTDTEPPPLPDPDLPPTVQLDVPAFDPVAGGSLTVHLTGEPGHDATITVLQDGAERFTTQATLVDGVATTTWDGRDASGVLLSAGPATLRVTTPAGEAEATIALVRAGFIAARAEDDGGVTATAIPMYWGGDRVLQDLSQPIVSLPSLDDDAGAAVPFPAVTTRLAQWSAIDGVQPVAWTAGSQPMLSLDLATATALGGTGLDQLPVHVRAAGYTVLAGDPLTEGAPVTLQRAAPLDATLGVTDERVVLEVFVDGADGAPIVLSAQELPVQHFRLLGPPTFGRNQDRYNPWAWAMFDLLTSIEGTPATHADAAGAVVSWVFNDLGLVYDTQTGASAYSYYGNGWAVAWDQPHFLFTDFLLRRMGDVINCTDAGNLVTTYANQLGAELHHIVILENFDLDFIRAIGTPDFTRCPFGPGGCGFSYHAVTTPDGGNTIWDATLVLDGDNDPGARPFTELPAQAIPGPEYLWRLVRAGNADYRFESQGTIE